MVNGNSVIFQIGKESTYATAVAGTEQIKISSESFKAVYNKVDEGLATGGKGSGLQQTMGIKAEGAFSTLMRPDMGNILYGALGQQDTEEDEDTSGVYHHTFTCIPSGESYHLPSWTAYVDRKIGKFCYPGCKVSSLSLQAAAGDYLKADVNFSGRTEETAATMPALTPSALKAFKFAHGKVYRKTGSSLTEIADITSIGLEINNNLDADTQTTGTGNYYAQPEAGTREISLSLEMIYSTAAETLRNSFYKSDDTLAVRVEFTADEMIGSTSAPNKLIIDLPCCQMNSADANMSGLERLNQSVSLNVADNLTDELITIDLVNARSTDY